MGHTMDGRAPPKKPWNDNSPLHTNKQWFPMLFRWCEMDFVHPQYFEAVTSMGPVERNLES